MGSPDSNSASSRLEKPPSTEIEDYEKYYNDVHVPVTLKVPGIKKIVVTRMDTSLKEGQPPELYLGAEVFFEDEESFNKARKTPEFAEMAADAAIMVGRWGNKLESSAGWESEIEVPGIPI